MEMKDLDKMVKEIAAKYKNSKSVSVYEERLESWDKIIDELREENKKLKESGRLYRNDCKMLRKVLKYYEEKIDFLNKVIVKYQEENEYLHQLLPEADGYIIEKQLEKRLWNDGEEDVYEDWGE